MCLTAEGTVSRVFSGFLFVFIWDAALSRLRLADLRCSLEGDCVFPTLYPLLASAALGVWRCIQSTSSVTSTGIYWTITSPFKIP